MQACSVVDSSTWLLRLLVLGSGTLEKDGCPATLEVCITCT